MTNNQNLNIGSIDSHTIQNTNGETIVVADYTNRLTDLYSQNGRKIIEINAQTGSITLGGFNPQGQQDGDLIINNTIGQQTIRLNGSSSQVTVGGASSGISNGEILVKKHGGETAIRLNAENATIRTGGAGSAGKVKVQDESGRVQAGLDAATKALLLRSPNGTLFQITVDNQGNLTTQAI
ncbi:MAG: hypothetical protein Kow0080_10650 [Candidatus Promineifilaceae bacterium]